MSRLCIMFLVGSFIISMYLHSVAAGAGEGFDLATAKTEVKGLLGYLYGLLGDNLSTASIDNAKSLSGLTSAADEFISQGEIDRLKKLALLPYNAEGMSSQFSSFKSAFSTLLAEDPDTANEPIPLTGDMNAISAVWEE